jgi:hypothetical protein
MCFWITESSELTLGNSVGLRIGTNLRENRPFLGRKGMLRRMQSALPWAKRNASANAIGPFLGEKECFGECNRRMFLPSQSYARIRLDDCSCLLALLSQ